MRLGTKIALGVPAAVLAIGIPFTARWEGTETTPYWDSIGRAWTVCMGETNVPMREYTQAECEAMFEPSWSSYYRGMVACFPRLPEAPATVQAMATDLAYNTGTAAVCNSRTTGGHLRAGRWRDFCNVLPSWAMSNGVRVRGLLNRRMDAREVCLSGITE
ncbi:endolysin [Rhodobacter phage RcCWillis]|nr:endolysin [Rhodobacter phage RcCWillis]